MQFDNTYCCMYVVLGSKSTLYLPQCRSEWVLVLNLWSLLNKRDIFQVGPPVNYWLSKARFCAISPQRDSRVSLGSFIVSMLVVVVFVYQNNDSSLSFTSLPIFEWKTVYHFFLCCSHHSPIMGVLCHDRTGRFYSCALTVLIWLMDNMRTPTKI